MTHKAAHHEGWEAVIGLEIHAQLNTKTKLFSSDRNHFGDEPNTNISPLSIGLPGSLPVLNKEAVKKAIQFGLAINGSVQKWSRFDRKSYFYPDCPRNYQITQLEYPIIKGGKVTAFVEGQEVVFGINRVQLEDDSGMLKHFSQFAGIDFNRSGVPLIEIVSEPCMHSAKEASRFAESCLAILDYLDASDCNMEEGSMRMDVNISVRKVGEKGLRNRIEIKNMNSFSNLELAIHHEIDRQVALYEKNSDRDPNEVLIQSTYRWDPDEKKTVLMRTKEDAEDYRYFPDPDLLPLVLHQEDIEVEKLRMPELPLQKEQRYIRELQLSELQAYFLTVDKRMAAFFEKAMGSEFSLAKPIANWISVEFEGRLKEKGVHLTCSGISPENIRELVLMVQNGSITGKIAKVVADDMVTNPHLSPREIVANNPEYRPFDDLELLQGYVRDVVSSNPQSIVDYKAGREKAFGFLVGQVMKLTKGAASPAVVNELLKREIKNISHE